MLGKLLTLFLRSLRKSITNLSLPFVIIVAVVVAFVVAHTWCDLQRFLNKKLQPPQCGFTLSKVHIIINRLPLKMFWSWIRVKTKRKWKGYEKKNESNLGFIFGFGWLWIWKANAYYCQISQFFIGYSQKLLSCINSSILLLFRFHLENLCKNQNNFVWFGILDGEMLYGNCERKRITWASMSRSTSSVVAWKFGLFWATISNALLRSSGHRWVRAVPSLLFSSLDILLR